jgi:Uma2 family endonuclease
MTTAPTVEALLLDAAERMELTEEGWVEKVVHPAHGRATAAATVTLYRLGVPETCLYDNVRLAADDAGLRYVPDLLVVRPENPVQPVDDQDYAGVPDLIVEAVSPSSVVRDEQEKRRRYATRGVPHYWLLYPHTLQLRWLRLEQGIYTEPWRTPRPLADATVPWDQVAS